MRGVSFLTFVVFLTLKLCGVVDWSWGFIVLPAGVLFGCAAREGEIEKALNKDLSNV
ncbi:hypothetical protein VT84_30790 [Gemmata sp. SH-PL17]|uniref:hypothetical protein n=1 Tax=Gemmata sp. SH-PL17 TaxID=1630693 RepID=UPI00078BB369|nr:hypothetical protein [Gemmata sp. SH-PL17]AMV28821.1 hypothetical protein VT84_30790 [Gemmata sp. SH-PL17]